MSNEEIPIVWTRNQQTGEYRFPKTHVDGVVGIDEYVENTVKDNVKFNDTGWIKYDVPSPVEKDKLFKAAGENGFNCGYRITKMFSVEEFHIRFNLRNIKNDTVIKLPDGLIKHSESFTLRSSDSRAPVKVAVRPNGNINLYPNTSDSNWTSDDYVYGEISFLNN